MSDSPSSGLTNLEKVHEHFRDYESPEIFITAAYLFCVSSCLGRKVWFQGGQPIFPNQQIVLVGPPGVGKTLPSSKMMDLVRSLQEVNPGTKQMEPLVKVAPTSITLERLFETLESVGTALGKDQTGDKPYFHSSLAFMLEGEMGDLFKPGPAAQNLTIFLNGGYDCRSKFEYETKRSGKNYLQNLCVNFFGATTPDWIERNLDSAVIGNGWSSRVVWLYGDEKRKLTTWLKFSPEQEQYLLDIKKHFRELCKLYGEVTMTPECFEAFDKWYQSDPSKNKINHDSKLDHYYGRKKLHALKYTLAFHFAESASKIIELKSFERALEFLAGCELHMNKALASFNQNPLALLAVEMLRMIKAAEPRGGCSTSEIMMELYAKSPKGQESILEVQSFLATTKQIKMLDNRYVTNKVVIDVGEEQFKQRNVKPLTDQEIKDVAFGK